MRISQDHGPHQGQDAGRPVRGRAGAALTVLVALALLLTGCSGGGNDSASKPAKSAADADRVEPLAAAPAPKLPVTVDSADGKKVTIDSTDRIVPLTGSLSEIVFTLGFGKQVVARDITATFEQAEKLPVVTRAHDVSAESVLSLKPTVVLADTTTGPAEAIDQIRSAGIPLLVVEPAKGLGDVGRRIDTVAEALGVPAAGTELKERTEARIAAVQKTIPDHADGKKPRVAFLYLRGSASVYLLGGAESGASSLLEAAGAVDAGKTSGLKKDFTAITSEALAKARARRDPPDDQGVRLGGRDGRSGEDPRHRGDARRNGPPGRHDRRRRAAELRPAHRPGARGHRRAAVREGRQGPVTTSYEERADKARPDRGPSLSKEQSAEAAPPGTEPTDAGAAAKAAAPGEAAEAPPAPKSPRSKAFVLTVGLSLALLAGCLLSAAIGAYSIPIGDVLGSLQHRIGLGGQPLDRVGESVLWNVRLPRVVLALLVGASLGCAGALMQGVFGNPLAEPGVIGISAGAAVGAVASIALGLTFFGNWTITVFAFIAGLGTVLLVYTLSRSGGRTEVVTLILTGIAVNAFAGALIGLFIFFADNAQITQITFWQLGSLSQATWPKVLAVLPCALAGLLIAPFYARKLDLLALGERPARHLGVDVERLRITLVLVVALLTAAAVAVAGIISFVGLLVPHLLRMANGPGHRFLVPGSALGGALVLVAGDLAARTVAAPAELPLGVLTALFGSPFFFWLLRRTRRKQGGWA